MLSYSAPVVVVPGEHTKDHRHCPACNHVRKSIMGAPLSAKLFPVAAEAWLHEHKRYIKPNTIHCYEECIKALTKFFGEMVVQDIDLANIRAYQDFRTQFAGNQRINIEISTLHQILQEAGCWKKIAEGYRPLPISRNGSGQSLTAEDEEKLLTLAFARHRLLLAHCLRLMLKTGCGFGEIRRLKLQDVHIEDRMFAVIEGAKNQHRQRLVPLIDGAFESMQWLLQRFKDLHGHQPTDYLLPFQPRRLFGHTDFRKPMVTIKRAWKLFKEEIKESDPEFHARIATFRIYDCRVTAITRTLSSSKVSLHTAKKLFGHVSEEMQRRYFKPDHETLRDALQTGLARKQA